MGKSLHPDRREFNLSYLIEERYNRIMLKGDAVIAISKFIKKK